MTSTENSSTQIRQTMTSDIDISAKVTFLRQPSIYPDRPSDVEVIETHMSWVFLTDVFVYKLKKPVRFEFLDFSTIERRYHDCLEEVRLNRRLAGDVYLKTVSLTVDPSGQLHLEGDGDPVDWLVKMRRLPRHRMLDHAIIENQIDEAGVRAFTETLVNFYQRAEPVFIAPDQYRQQFEQGIQANQTALSQAGSPLPGRQLAMIRDSLQHYLLQKPELFDERVMDRRIIEAHGDLRPEHVCLTDPPVFIDCLEFNRAFRVLDAADELAFLAMECEHIGAAFIGPLIFKTYRQLSGDFPPQSLLTFYKAYRAQLRAKLSIWHLEDHDLKEHEKWIQRTKTYLSLAAHYAEILHG